MYNWSGKYGEPGNSLGLYLFTPIPHASHVDFPRKRAGLSGKDSKCRGCMSGITGINRLFSSRKT